MAKHKSPHRRDSAEDGLPAVAVLEITGTDADGEAVARPLNWRDDDRQPPLIHVLPDKRAKMRQAAPGVGERVLARLERTDANTYTARVIRRLSAPPERFIGLMEANGRIRPTDRRFVSEFTATPGGVDAKPGELVIAEALGRSRRHGLREARVVELLGRVEGTEAYSRIAILGRDIPDTFSDAALAQAVAAGPAPLDDRADLRAMPLVTVDDEDARDFDDAVFAEPDSHAGNEGGWRLTVAIADVAWYVRHGDALDREARERGNSVYLPDKVVPMLPEALSNGWCSLQPEEERPCLAMHMVINRNGRMTSHRLERGLMRSAARLTYRQIAAFWDGDRDAIPAPVTKAARNLEGAFQSLLRERTRRQPLELVLPERRVVFEEGGGFRVEERPHFASHRMIEEFMIAANIAAAEIIGKRKSRALFRVHDEPPPDKLAALVETLRAMGYPTPKGQVLLPQHFNGIIEMATDENERALLSDLILRSQAQAIYAAADDGHFGLRLRHYAHFTSPIRRYADLVVHRALIKSLGLGPGGWTGDAGSLEAAAEHVSMTERRAVDAEREAMDRFAVAAAERTTEGVATGRVTGVIRAGLFVTLDGVGSDGFIPKRLLPRDSYILDEAGQSLRGRRSKRRFRLGDRLDVTIKEADPLAARLLLEPAGEKRASNAPKPPKGAKKSKKSRKNMR